MIDESNSFATICNSLQKFAKICQFVINRVHFGYWIKLVAWYSGKHRDLLPGRPEFDPLQSSFFKKKSVSDYVVNVQLTSSLRISERENSQIQELAPRAFNQAKKNKNIFGILSLKLKVKLSYYKLQMHGHWFGNTVHKNSSSSMQKTKASRKPNRRILSLFFQDGFGHPSDMLDQLSSVLSPLLTQAFLSYTKKPNFTSLLRSDGGPQIATNFRYHHATSCEN